MDEGRAQRLIGCDVWVNMLVWKWGHEKKWKRKTKQHMLQRHDLGLDWNSCNWKQSVQLMCKLWSRNLSAILKLEKVVGLGGDVLRFEFLLGSKSSRHCCLLGQKKTQQTTRKHCCCRVWFTVRAQSGLAQGLQRAGVIYRPDKWWHCISSWQTGSSTASGQETCRRSVYESHQKPLWWHVSGKSSGANSSNEDRRELQPSSKIEK